MLLEGHEKFAKFALSKSKFVPREVLEKASAKISDFGRVKAYILKELQGAFNKFEAVKKTIKANLKNSRNPEGVLTHHEKAYIGCF